MTQSQNNSALSSIGGSAVGALVSGIFNQAFSGVNSARSLRNSRKLMASQDNLNRKFTHDSYGIMRSGLEDADYNPLLALGSSANTAMPNATQGISDSDQGTEIANSAIGVANAIAGIKNVNANSALATEQAKTEQSKRENLEFQNSMLDVQKHLADKDLDSYDRRMYSNLYEQFQRAENYRASSAIGAYNAETQRQNVQNQYKLGREQNAINRNRSGYQNFKDYYDSKYGNPLKTTGFAWDKATYKKQGNIPSFWY